MIEGLKVKTGPQFYQFSPDAIAQVPNLLVENHAQRVLILHGEQSWKNAQPFMQDILLDNRFKLSYEKFGGECSYYEGDRISQIIASKKIDFIIGVGGGKLCDLTKLAAEVMNIKFGLIPTLASNCAPWAPVSVMYQENGLSEGKTVYMNRQAAFMVSDPQLTVTAPVNFFIAGIADTLAKWYESELILKQEQYCQEPFIRMARLAAQICREELFQSSKEAIEDAKRGKFSTEYCRISEIIIGIAGLVGGLSDEFGRNNLAHALHDGLSAYLPELHNFLHGEKIAYCVCYQLALEEKWEDQKLVQEFFMEVGLPTSLSDMGVQSIDVARLEQVVHFVFNQKKVHLLPLEISIANLNKTFSLLEAN